MGNMYDKLGDMLNDVLKAGKIPEENKNQKNVSNTNENKNENQNVIKFTKLENLPENIKNAFIYLECSPEMTLEEIRIVYHNKLKAVHPDKTTIQNQKTDNKNAHYTVQKLNQMYKILNNYYTNL